MALTPARTMPGVLELLPLDQIAFQRMLDTIRRNYERFGFLPIETPVIEHSDVLLTKSGGETERQVYFVQSTGALGAAAEKGGVPELALRFDLTVPLARYYASHRAELPAVFRSIQVAPVWRAERPQKGRYRQFVQCDIDIIGEPGIRAEAELLIATLDTVDRLGLTDSFIRVNDRRLLIGMLVALGFGESEHAQVLITIDKLDKVGEAGVIEELRERGATPAAVDALDEFFRRPVTMEYLPFGERAIRKALPPGADDEVVAQLAELGDAVTAARGADPMNALLRFDPFLVRGMGYYTGPIFELAHPSVSYSLGGGGRYDGMIGRFLGTDIPATGFSLGFERLVDLLDAPADESSRAIALLHDADAPLADLLSLKSVLVAEGARVRLLVRPKNMKAALDALSADGFTHFAVVERGSSDPGSLELRPLT